MQAFTPQKLAEKSFQNLTDITQIAPAVRFQGQGNVAATEVTMRGLGTAPASTAGPAVTIYFSDVPFINSAGSNLPTYDLGGLQVLKGPQGTQFGRNALGGAILVNPAAPTYDTFSGYLQADLGDYNYHQLEGAVNMTLVPHTLALRVAGQWRQRDGYTKNLAGTGDFDDVDSEGTRVSLLFTPGDIFRNTLVLDYYKSNTVGAASVGQSNPDFSFALPVILAGGDPAKLAVVNADIAQVQASIAQANAIGPRAVDTGPAKSFIKTPFTNIEKYGLYNTTELDLSDNLLLKNIVGYRNNRTDIEINNGGLSVPLFSIASVSHTQTLTEELQLQGHSFNKKLDWILGAFYMDDKPAGNNATVTEPGLLLSSLFSGLPTLALPGNVQNAHLWQTSHAVFANAYLHLTDQIRINAGYRYTWDAQKVCLSKVSNLLASTADLLAVPSDADGCQSAPPALGQGVITGQNNAPTYQIGADWRPNDRLFFYFTFSRGYRSGGINTANFNSPCTTGMTVACNAFQTSLATLLGIPLTLAPTLDLTPFQQTKDEFVNNYEVGMKSDWKVFGMDGRANLSLYRMDYTNILSLIQLQTLLSPFEPATPPFGTIGFNAGVVRIQGAEFELALAPTRDLLFTVNGAYTSQKQLIVGAPPAGLPASLAIPPATLAAPLWSFTTSARYVLPFRLLDSPLVFNADWFHTERYATQGSPMPGYDVVNLRLEWSDIAASGVDVAFWIRNVADKDYFLSPVINTNPSFPVRVYNHGEPRMFGFQLKYRFGAGR